MSEQHYLVGAEEVRRAGAAMQDAASTMQAAANSISSTVETLERALNRSLEQFEGLVQRLEALKETTP